MGAGACGIWGHREEAQRALHETMRLAEARLERRAPGGSMPSEAPKHCKIQSRRDAPKMAILEAPCAQNAPGRSTIQGKEKHININKFAGLSRDWAGGKILFMCFFGSFLMGEKKHINKIPPKIPGQPRENFVYVFCSLCVFFAPQQCAHRKHCYPEIPLGSPPTSRASQRKGPGAVCARPGGS